MSNRELIQSLYAAHARGDVGAVFAALDEGVEIRQSPAVPWGGVYRGHAGAAEFFTKLGAHIETTVEVDRMITAGDAVVETGKTRGRTVRSGREFAIDETHVWRVRDGKVVSMEAFVDDAAMLAALAD